MSFNVGDNVYVLEMLSDTDDGYSFFIIKRKISSLEIDDESNILYNFSNDTMVYENSLFLTLADVITDIKNTYSISELSFKCNINDIIYTISDKNIPGFNSKKITINKSPLLSIELHLIKEDGQVTDIIKYYHTYDIRYIDNRVHISVSTINLSELF